MWNFIIPAVTSLASAAMSKPKRISAPPPRSYLGEMKSALNAQAEIMPQYIGLQKAFNPQFQALQQQTLMGQLGVLKNVYGQAMPMGAELGAQNTRYMSPVLAGIGKSAQGAYGSMLGPYANGLLATMQRQALSDLSAGRGLTAEEEMMAQQSARAASQAMGLGGNQAIAREVLMNNALATNREAQRRAYAANVYGASEGSAMNAYNMYGQPLTQMISAFTPSGMLGQAGASSAEYANRFNPESQYNSDIMGSNLQNQMSAQMANAQARAGWTSGLMSMAGQLGGAYLGNQGLFSGTNTTSPMKPVTLAEKINLGQARQIS